MIITCEKCNKKFEISDNLIPDEGRLVECGSCSHQWLHYPLKKIKLKEEVKNLGTITTKKKKIKKKNTEKILINKKNDFINFENQNTKKNKNVGFLSYLLIITISLVALILFLDTFKDPIILYFPSLDFYLTSLYESLIDIFLFFKDLIK